METITITNTATTKADGYAMYVEHLLVEIVLALNVEDLIGANLAITSLNRTWLQVKNLVDVNIKIRFFICLILSKIILIALWYWYTMNLDTRMDLILTA